MSGARLRGDLVRLAGALSPRDLAILEACQRLRLVSAVQLQRLCFGDIAIPATRAAFARRSLGRLYADGLLGRLERRVGGVRRGSQSYVYFLAPAGQRLLAYQRGDGAVMVRRQHEPGAAYVAHTLAQSELFVRLREAERAGRLELVELQGEPECWRSYPGGLGVQAWLKADAFVVIGVGEWEERAFVEVDRATHGRTALRRKAGVYLDYLRSGQEERAAGVLPRVLWIVPGEARRQVLEELIARLPGPAGELFTVAVMDEAVDVLTRAIQATSGGPS